MGTPTSPNEWGAPGTTPHGSEVNAARLQQVVDFLKFHKFNPEDVNCPRVSCPDGNILKKQLRDFGCWVFLVGKIPVDFFLRCVWCFWCVFCFKDIMVLRWVYEILRDCVANYQGFSYMKRRVMRCFIQLSYLAWFEIWMKSCRNFLFVTLPESKSKSTWKWMVGRILFIWDGLFSGTMLVWGSVHLLFGSYSRFLYLLHSECIFFLTRCFRAGVPT